MEAAVTIDLAGGVASASLVRILVQGAAVALGPDEGVTGNIAGGITNISILSGGLSIATAPSAAFGGTVTLALQWTGPAPAVTLDNLAPAPHGEPATIRWPTASGQETQILTPGTPLTLSGITGG